MDRILTVFGHRVPRCILPSATLFVLGAMMPHAAHAAVYGFPHGEVRVADLNQDGWPDVVLSDPAGNAVRVRRGAGDGSLATGSSISISGAPTEIAVGDLNGDGQLDLVVALTGLSEAAVRLGRADGVWTFAPGVTLPGLARTVAVGDLNHDGRLDLVAGTESPRAVVSMLGNGDGTFAAPVHLFTPGHRPANLHVLDISGDTNPDVVGLIMADSVFAGLGDGAGGFASLRYTELPFRTIFGDSYDQIVPAEPLKIWRRPDGSHAAWAFSPEPFSLILHSSVDVATYYVGSFTPGGGYTGERFWASLLEEPLGPVFDMGEITGDGETDFVCNRGSSTVVYTGSPPEFPGFFSTFAYTGSQPVTGLEFGDINLDGIPDVVTAASLAVNVRYNPGPWGGSFFGGGALPYTITASAGPNGTIFPAGALATGALGTRTFSITPDPGHQVEDVVVDGASVGARTTYTFAGVDADHTIAVTFSEITTPTLASLVRIEELTDRLRLTWYTAGGRPRATVYRRTEETDWEVRASISADGSGLLTWEDDGMAPGVRYGYRLGFASDGGETFAGETWAVLGAPALGLHGPTPNPSAAGRLAVAFALPTSGPATLSVFDHAGRRVLEREVGALGAGRHTVDLTAARPLAPGVYLIRLRQGPQSRVVRGVVLR